MNALTIIAIARKLDNEVRRVATELEYVLANPIISDHAVESLPSKLANALAERDKFLGKEFGEV